MITKPEQSYIFVKTLERWMWTRRGDTRGKMYHCDILYLKLICKEKNIIKIHKHNVHTYKHTHTRIPKAGKVEKHTKGNSIDAATMNRPGSQEEEEVIKQAVMASKSKTASSKNHLKNTLRTDWCVVPNEVRISWLERSPPMKNPRSRAAPELKPTKRLDWMMVGESIQLHWQEGNGKKYVCCKLCSICSACCHHRIYILP